MNRNYLYGLFAVVVLALLVIFIKSNHKLGNQASGRLQVVASFYPLYFFSSEIAGDKATVTNITPAAAEPHDYEPTAGDIANIENSGLLILNGGGLEAWGENIQKNIDPKHTRVVVAGAGLTNQEITEEGEKITDPHIWLDPVLAQKMVDKISEGFTQADMANKDYYVSNAVALKNKLADLDTAYREGLKSCMQKNIITSHAAFGYLATQYGLNQVSIAGLSPDAEPSSKELADIAKFAKDNNVKYIFFESLVSPKLSETIAREVGAQTMVLNPIEGLTDEELAAGKTYFSEMGNNLKNLRIALECK
jgi:zinc transport system substrate-binding protein